jgi:thiol:disulfide interchange protein DsbA
MKKLFNALFLLFIVIGLTTPAVAAPTPAIKAGEHYNVVTPPQAGGEGERIQVIEFFLYSCGHCYRLEPHMKKWLETKPANVDFIRIPAMFKRATLIMHAKTYYALELMGVPQAVHDGIFDSIHVKKKGLKTQADVEAQLKGLGVDIEQYRKAMKSFAVQANASRAARLLDRFNIRGVPAIIVDGKYHASGLEPDFLVKVTDHLIDKVKEQKGSQ